MPSDKPARRLLDIIENGQAIARYTEGMDGTTFEEDSLVSDAVERCLERISEAVTKLGDQAAVLLPTQPWHKIRAFGNVLRHEYDDIIKDRLWRSFRTTSLLWWKLLAQRCATYKKADN